MYGKAMNYEALQDSLKMKYITYETILYGRTMSVL